MATETLQLRGNASLSPAPLAHLCINAGRVGMAGDRPRTRPVICTSCRAALHLPRLGPVEDCPLQHNVAPPLGPLSAPSSCR